MRPLNALPLLLLLACACEFASPPEDRRGSGNVIRHQRDDGWAPDRAWRLSFASRIGGAGATGADAFGAVVDVAFDALGRVWVADEMQQQIKIFERDGTFVRSIGRKGGGPGEFRSIAGFDWSPDGTLWIVDAGNPRFTVLDTAGRLLATHPRFSSMMVTPWPGGFDRHGNLADVGARRESGGVSVASVVRLSPDLGSADTLRLPPLKEQFFGAVTSGDARTQHVKQAPVPFTATQIWGVDPEGYAWIALTDRYRLERRAFDGTVNRVVELQNTARRVSSADKDQILENYRWFEQAGGRLDRSLIPDHHPDLENLFFDGEGHLWVLPTYFRGEKPRIDIFELNGRYLGQVQAPVPFISRPAPAIRDGWVAAVARDGDGVDAVVVMRLDKPAS